jgi:hypothetical protein
MTALCSEGGNDVVRHRLCKEPDLLRRCREVIRNGPIFQPLHDNFINRGPLLVALAHPPIVPDPRAPSGSSGAPRSSLRAWARIPFRRPHDFPLGNPVFRLDERLLLDKGRCLFVALVPPHLRGRAGGGKADAKSTRSRR